MFAGRKETMKEKNNCPTVKAEDCTISFNDEYVLISHKKKFFKKYLTMEEHEKLFKNISKSYWDKKYKHDQITLLENTTEIEKKSEKVLVNAKELSADIGLMIDKF